jgi:hypothetical protein
MSAICAMSALRPLMLQERRQSGHRNTSRLCHFRTGAPAANNVRDFNTLFNHLVGERGHASRMLLYDCGLRQLHTLNAFTGRLKPLRTSSPANAASARVSMALNTLMSTNICPFLA